MREERGIAHISIPPGLPPLHKQYVSGRVRKGLKTAVKPILKSLRSLSLAAQIDVRPCFTFNSIGQKTAIRRWDAVGSVPRSLVHCADDSPRRLIADPPANATNLPAPTRIRADLQLGARGKDRSLERFLGYADTKLSLSITR